MTAPRRDSQRTRFCGNLFGSAVPVSARCSAETGTLYLQAASPSPWPIRLFTRRNRYGDQNAEPRGPRQTASSRVGFSDESSEFVSPVRRPVEMPAVRSWRTVTQKQVRMAPGPTARSVHSLSLEWRKSWDKKITSFVAHADLGTQVHAEFALIHAETGTLRWPTSCTSPQNCKIGRRNGYAHAETHRNGRANPLFSVDNTVDNMMLSPQIPVRPMRRSGYGFAQKRVRHCAESGSHPRRIWFGLPH